MLKTEEISADRIKSGIGGYNKKETKEYIDTLRKEYETLIKENIELKDKLGILSEGVQYYKNMEKSLQKALVLAEKTTSETMQAAEVKAVAMEKEAQSRAEIMTKEAKMRADAYEKEATIKAENLMRDAKHKADEAVAQGNEELRKIHSQIMTLIQQYEQYKSQYKQLAMAQMQVLESDAYNLDAPILQSISSSLENVDAIKKNLTNSSESTTDNSQEVVEPVKTPVTTESVEQEKKVYVDARGQVVEVHEFREVTSSGADTSKDLWESEPEEDETNTFDDFSEEYKGPFSFSQNEEKEETDLLKQQPASNESLISETKQNFVQATPIMKEMEKSPVVQSSFPTSTVSDVQLNQEPSFQVPTHTNLNLQENTSMQEENVYDFHVTPESNMEEENKNDVTLQEEENIPQSGNVSAEEMRRIEKMQLERLKEQEEKQVALLKSERYHNFSNPSSNPKDTESIKEQDHTDIFRALHKNDDSAATVTLQDLKQQQELENSSVELPKASVQSLSELQTNKETIPMNDVLSFEPLDMTSQNLGTQEKTVHYTSSEKINSTGNDFFHQLSEESVSNFHATPSAEEGNSLDFEMDNSQDIFGSDRKESPKFKSFRDFESEL